MKQEDEDEQEIVLVEDCEYRTESTRHRKGSHAVASRKKKNEDPIEHRIRECGRLGLPLPPRPDLWDTRDGKKQKK